MAELIINGIKSLDIHELQDVISKAQYILDEKYDLYNHIEISNAEKKFLNKLYNKYTVKKKALIDKGKYEEFSYTLSYENIYNDSMYPIDIFVLIYNYEYKHECFFTDDKNIISHDDTRVYLQLYVKEGKSPVVICENCFNDGKCPGNLSHDVDFERLDRIMSKIIK